eukprot:7909270-Ditylum_brightwellii.AAC.1
MPLGLFIIGNQLSKAQKWHSKRMYAVDTAYHLSSRSCNTSPPTGRQVYEGSKLELFSRKSNTRLMRYPADSFETPNSLDSILILTPVSNLNPITNINSG